MAVLSFKESRAQKGTPENKHIELRYIFPSRQTCGASDWLIRTRFGLLSQNYEAEQKQLEAEIITLQRELEVQEQQSKNLEKFIQKARKYASIETLDAYTLHEPVSAIYVGAPDKSSGKRRQHIHIKYDSLGFIPLDELMKEETA